ncbi:hypothetical protein [Tellurirhabdus bombi]|uniref:hypothetical protein n=1 Tax=Tellurirhabdus bombi TaxID=2907205 RepID=UPI001F445063|nr:hypothetical protein [Tellurirhabdus bombi]
MANTATTRRKTAHREFYAIAGEPLPMYWKVTDKDTGTSFLDYLNSDGDPIWSFKTEIMSENSDTSAQLTVVMSASTTAQFGRVIAGELTPLWSRARAGQTLKGKFVMTHIASGKPFYLSSIQFNFRSGADPLSPRQYAEGGDAEVVTLEVDDEYDLVELVTQAVVLVEIPSFTAAVNGASGLVDITATPGAIHFNFNIPSGNGGTVRKLDLVDAKNGDTVPHNLNTKLIEFMQVRDSSGNVLREGFGVQPTTLNELKLIAPEADLLGNDYRITGPLYIKYSPEPA